MFDFIGLFILFYFIFFLLLSNYLSIYCYAFFFFFFSLSIYLFIKETKEREREREREREQKMHNLSQSIGRRVEGKQKIEKAKEGREEGKWRRGRGERERRGREG